MNIKKDVAVLRKNRKNRLVDKFGNKFNISFVPIKVFPNFKNSNRIEKKILFSASTNILQKMIRFKLDT